MSGADHWPVALTGISETLVTTRGPDDNWNVAALGVHAPGRNSDTAARARTWGRTRTSRNFRREGEGYVQFATDPVVFAEAALTVRESPDPVLDEALAWARVSVTPLETGETRGTEWTDWRLEPVESSVVRRVVPRTNRGAYAVVEATIAVSRLDAPGYDAATLRDRLARLEEIIERCGGDAEQRALAVIRDTAEW